MKDKQNSREQLAELKMREAVRRLTLPAKEALSQIPAGAQRPDGLAFEFEAAYEQYMASINTLPTPSQLAALQQLDAELLSMSGVESVALWTETSVAKHPQWRRIRQLAKNVLNEFGW